MFVETSIRARQCKRARGTRHAFRRCRWVHVAPLQGMAPIASNPEMSMSRWTSISRRLLHVALPFVTVSALQLGCKAAPPQAMVSGAGVPASEGTVEATAADNGNTNVAIHVKHLAPPSKVAADATVYVVWIQPRNAPRQSVGALRVNDDLQGSLDTVTPHRRFLVMVTPEPSGQVAQPTHEPVFTSEVDRVE